MTGMRTQTYELVRTSCAECGIQFAVPEPWDENRRDTGSGFWCPNGHSLVYKSRIKELEKALHAEQARVTHAEDQRRAAERSLAAAKGQATKLRKRAVAGVCPCCHRTFAQMARHMASKHPDYAEREPAS